MNTVKNTSGLFAVMVILLVVCSYTIHAQTLTSFEKKGKYGFKDETGKVIVEAKFKSVKEFSEGLAAVQIKDKWGFIDKTGLEVIAAEYYEVQSFSDGLSVAKKGVLEKSGYIDTKGVEALPFTFGSVGSFHNGFAKVAALVDSKLKYGFIDKSGNRVVNPVYDYVADVNELWEVKLDGKNGYLDSTLKIVVPIAYDVTRGFKEDLAAVNIGGKFNQNYIIEGGKWGFVDENGKIIAPLIYDDVESFNSNGMAKVKLNGEEFFINKLGERVK